MKIKNIIMGSIVGLFLFTGCTYKNAELNYKQYHAYTLSEGGNLKYKEIGPIYASASGFAWDDCSDIASKVLKRLESKAKALGGDDVINIKWYGEHSLYTIPTCKCGCGWFALYIIGGLGPWVQTAKAEGVAIKFLDSNKTE
ncbi:hypothetical protein C3L23_04835 [Nautilia sp. PV-1]|uniref:hypothetical protein n=1 Tax=Nautilia sp. PV-1 TaxID=2579250 RepID=UPI000FD83B07|nr:hypothetical protein [Nautilia sp. PV-1]AZV46623.1 hypothetical protein C3L23_04835 [Nautilia sp. PV-1]